MLVSPIFNHNASDELARVMRSMNFDDRIRRPAESVYSEASSRQTEQRQKDTNDVLKYQFWPRAVGMGSLVGRRFVQVSDTRHG